MTSLDKLRVLVKPLGVTITLANDWGWEIYIDGVRVYKTDTVTGVHGFCKGYMLGVQQ